MLYPLSYGGGDRSDARQHLAKAVIVLDNLTRVTATNTVVLVEGASDQNAVEALAGRVGRNLTDEGVSVVAMGGAAGFGDHLDDLHDHGGFVVRIAGLCDEAETSDLRRGLERVGFGPKLSRLDMEGLGFFFCSVDLEDELIRALGVSAVEEVFDDQGELRGFRVFQNQPAWRGRALEEQMHRFIGIRSGRKVRYGRLLVDALDLDQVPEPLTQLLDHI